MRSHRKIQRGASLVGFGIVANTVYPDWLGSLQAGLFYHTKTTLIYSIFEAARASATRHALPGPMRAELGARQSPLIGGEGSAEKTVHAIAHSIAKIDTPVSMEGRQAPALAGVSLCMLPHLFHIFMKRNDWERLS